MQSKLGSLLEAKTNALSGLLLSWAVYVYLAPALLDIHMSGVQGAKLTILFTVLSILRQYLIRRVFNRFSQVR